MLRGLRSDLWAVAYVLMFVGVSLIGGWLESSTGFELDWAKGLLIGMLCMHWWFWGSKKATDE